MSNKQQLNPEERAAKKAAFSNLLKRAQALAEAGAEKTFAPYVSHATGGQYSRYNQCLIEEQRRINGRPDPVNRELLTFSQIRAEKLHLRAGSRSVLVAYTGDDPTGKVKVDENGERSIEAPKEGREYAPRAFRLFFLEDCEAQQPREATANPDQLDVMEAQQ